MVWATCHCEINLKCVVGFSAALSFASLNTVPTCVLIMPLERAHLNNRQRNDATWFHVALFAEDLPDLATEARC